VFGLVEAVVAGPTTLSDGDSRGELDGRVLVIKKSSF
jgi:hypothetical protein